MEIMMCIYKFYKSFNDILCLIFYGYFIVYFMYAKNMENKTMSARDITTCVFYLHTIILAGA